MKIAFIGCVRLSHSLLAHTLTLPGIEVVAIVTREVSSFNSDFQSLEDIARQNDIPLYIARANEQSDMARWLSGCQPDIIYCFGWSYLLGSELLSVAAKGVVGFHPSALPYNRGRHPLTWALALGLESTASTFFFMDEGADTGDILSQRTVGISETDNATSLYEKIADIAGEQVTEFTAALVSGNNQRTPQPQGVGNLWRKRGRLDGQIDWRMSASSIHNLVRALTHPYVGAHCSMDGNDIKIWETKIVDSPVKNIEPGKVLAIGDDGAPVVKCGVGAIALTNHEFPELPQEGSYL
jgi:methionyl-tRNA formyltransferase